MCSHEHLCVVANHRLFSMSASYIFCSIGVLQLVAATMCVLSAMLTPSRLCFSVLRVSICLSGLVSMF